MNLRRSFIIALVVASGGSAWAGTADNPYTPIVTRNIFGLVPIPVHDPKDDVPETPPPKITPNGIMTLFGKLQVLFKVAGVAKPGQPPKDESYVMGEGERQDEIEVQAIDEKSATITFNNHGTVQKLALVAGTASGGAPVGPAPGLTPAGMPLPSAAPVVGGGNPAIGFGGRFGRARPNAPGVGSPVVGGGPGFGGAAAPSATANTGETLSPEAQVIMMEAQREQFKAAGNPAAAIIPPTPITQQLNDEENGAAGGPPMPGQ